MGFCRNCGNEVPEGNKFCPECGTAVDVEAAVRMQQDHENSAQETNSSGTNIYGNPAQNTSYNNTNMQNGNAYNQNDVDMFSTEKKGKKKNKNNADKPKKGIIRRFIRTVIWIIVIYGIVTGIMEANKMGLFKSFKNKKTEVSEEIKDTVENKSTNNLASSAEANSVASSNTNASSDTSSTIDGVDPDLKAFLDSYEDFVDEYVDFMKKYLENPNNALSMLGDYTKIMTKYEDFAAKIEKYDEKQMSTADAKYYLDVVNKCNKKMLEMY